MGDLQPARVLALPVDQQREESMLGASEAGAVMSLDRWKSPMAVWRKHRGLPVDDKQNEAAEWGVLQEPIIRGKYALMRGRHVRVPVKSFTRDGWLRATPDGIVEDDHPTEQPTVYEAHDNVVSYGDVLLQVKTTSAYLAEDWIGGPPRCYEVQCRVEMAVVDLPFCDIVCLIGGQRLVGPFRIERDAKIERSILTRLRDFWSMVQDGREPTVDDSDAWRLHVSEKLGKAPALEVVATEEQRDIVKRWRAARNSRKIAERNEERIKNELLLNLSHTGATKLDAGELGKPSAYRTKSGTWALRMPTFWRDDE